MCISPANDAGESENGGRTWEVPGGEGRQRCWPGATERAHPGIPIGSLTPSGLILQEPISRKNQSSPRAPRTLSTKNFDTCLHCKLSTGIPTPSEGSGQ